MMMNNKKIMLAIAALAISGVAAGPGYGNESAILGATGGEEPTNPTEPEPTDFFCFDDLECGELVCVEGSCVDAPTTTIPTTAAPTCPEGEILFEDSCVPINTEPTAPTTEAPTTTTTTTEAPTTTTPICSTGANNCLAEATCVPAADNLSLTCQCPTSPKLYLGDGVNNCVEACAGPGFTGSNSGVQNCVDEQNGTNIVSCVAITADLVTGQGFLTASEVTAITGGSGSGGGTKVCVFVPGQQEDEVVDGTPSEDLPIGEQGSVVDDNAGEAPESSFGTTAVVAGVVGVGAVGAAVAVNNFVKAKVPSQPVNDNMEVFDIESADAGDVNTVVGGRFYDMMNEMGSN